MSTARGDERLMLLELIGEAVASAAQYGYGRVPRRVGGRDLLTFRIEVPRDVLARVTASGAGVRWIAAGPPIERTERTGAPASTAA